MWPFAIGNNMRIEQVTYDTANRAMCAEMCDHWDEVPFGPFDMDLELDHASYLLAEEQDYARFYLVYDDSDKAIAYMSVFANEMIQHKGTIQAVTDAFYVAPDYRKSGVFGKLVEFVEQDLKAYGIRFFTIGTNPMYKGKTEQYLDHIGYCKTEVLYTKEL